MGIGTLLIAAAAGGATYAIAKNKNKTNGEAALAGAAVGAGTAIALPLAMGALFWAAVIGIPVAGGYYLFTKDKQKALPPGS